LKLLGFQVSFTIDGIHPHDVAAYCDTYGICIRAGFHCAQPLAQALALGPTVRVSFYAYNSAADVNCLLEVIAHLVG
jgi:cysteine desulfurase/selenocysteine lyase